jgi:hypothetical protein
MDAFETITMETTGGYHAVIGLHDDPFMGCPWDEHDGHGPVSDWTTRDKGPGERVLCEDRGSRRYYDAQAATIQAKRDGWGLSADHRAQLAAGLGREPTPGEVTAEAVRLDYEYLRGWCNDEWRWVGWTATVTTPDGEELPEDSCWGYDDIDAATEAAREAVESIAREHARELEAMAFPAVPA